MTYVENETIIRLRKMNNSTVDEVKLNKGDFEWLIGQAEAVSKLKEALEFYADEANHPAPFDDPLDEFNGESPKVDWGKKARLALGYEENGHG